MAKTTARKKIEAPVKPEVPAKPAIAAKPDIKPAPAPNRLLVANRVDAFSPSNFAFEWKCKQDGSGELHLAYEGPLAKRDAVVAHVGTWREGGEPWSGQLELTMRRDGPGRFVGTLPVPAGAPLRAVEIAMRHGDTWDNGGRAPLGYYEWRVGDQQIAAI